HFRLQPGGPGLGGSTHALVAKLLDGRGREAQQPDGLHGTVGRAGEHFAHRYAETAQGLSHGKRVTPSAVIQLAFAAYVVGIYRVRVGQFPGGVGVAHDDDVATGRQCGGELFTWYVLCLALQAGETEQGEYDEGKG